MKKHLLASIAMIAALAACKEETPIVEPADYGLEVGCFSVAADKRVVFSTGNLHTTDGADGCPEIENYLCDDSHIYGRGTGLLPWSDWGACYADKTGDDGWRMLTGAEWKYLLDERPGPRFLNATGTPVVVSGVKCYGLLIFPDDYSGDAGYLTYTWEEMQSLGIAFLPASGCDYLSAEDGTRKYGRYWAADAFDGDLACNISFGPNGVCSYNAFPMKAGYAVRLVKDAK